MIDGTDINTGRFKQINGISRAEAKARLIQPRKRSRSWDDVHCGYQKYTEDETRTGRRQAGSGE